MSLRFAFAGFGSSTAKRFCVALRPFYMNKIVAAGLRSGAARNPEAIRQGRPKSS